MTTNRTADDYVGPDQNGRALFDNELVLFEQRVWRLSHRGDLMTSISGDAMIRTITVGTRNLERL